jgi:hypothetical protein
MILLAYSSLAARQFTGAKREAITLKARQCRPPFGGYLRHPLAREFRLRAGGPGELPFSSARSADVRPYCDPRAARVDNESGRTAGLSSLPSLRRRVATETPMPFAAEDNLRLAIRFGLMRLRSPTARRQSRGERGHVPVRSPPWASSTTERCARGPARPPG